MYEVVDFSLLIDVVPCAAAIHTAMSCGRGERPYVVSCIYLSFIRGRCVCMYMSLRMCGRRATPSRRVVIYGCMSCVWAQASGYAALPGEYMANPRAVPP